jgi:uncharacterized protein YfdQ (DUF2303 family)
MQERNIADALAEHLPKPATIITNEDIEGGGQVDYVALPKGFELKKVDNEDLLEHPRRAKTTATLSDPASFLAYVRQHATLATKVWCDFDPQTFRLAFTAVIDDHHQQTAGWRGHTAVYRPDMSAEWKVWTGQDEKPLSQLEFAAFLERNSDDINTGEGGDTRFPSSLDMLKMATEFEANSDKSIKSVVRLQSGGYRFDCVDDEDAATRSQMQVFERFMIGIPVFFAGVGYRIQARLKYRNSGGKLAFWYELIRPDSMHEHAARELIQSIGAGLALVNESVVSSVPLLMGSCK